MRGRPVALATRATGLGLVGALCFACGPDAAGSGAETSAMAAASHDGGRNQAPVIRNLHLEPAQPSVGDTLRAVASVADAEGDDVSLSYDWEIDGEPEIASGAEMDLSSASPGATIQVTAHANDGIEDGEAVTAIVVVIDRAPVLNGVALEPTRQVHPGDAIRVMPTGSDPDGQPVDFRAEWLVNGETTAETGLSFSSEGLKQGDRIRVRVVATDGRNDSRPWESSDIVVQSAHPEIVSTPPGMTDGGLFRYAVEVRDPDGDKNLRFRLDQAPDGMRIDPVLGVIEWHPRGDQAGVHPVAVVVSDSTRLETTQRFEVTVNAGPAAPEPGR